MLTRTQIRVALLDIFEQQFEISNPDLNENLRDTYEFDSIDAIELLREIELLLETQLTRNEKKAAMEIRTLNQIIDYVETLSREHARTQNP